MTRTPMVLTLALLFFSKVPYAANITSDASLTTGNAVATSSTGNQASNPFVTSKCSSGHLWQLVPDPWGVNKTATGSIKMEYSGTGSIVTTVNLSNLASMGVNGYPFVFYGSDPYGYHVNGQPLTFPAQLSSMSSLTVDVNYSLAVSGMPPGDLDIAFDEWLIPSATYTGGPSGALEVMVAPYFAFSWAPAGYFVESVKEPVIINGKATTLIFDEYATGTGAGHEIIFFPHEGQIPSGDVRLNLLDFMNRGAITAGLNSSWFLAGIDFGTEFGHTTSAQYTLTTNKIDIEQDLIQPESPAKQ